LDGEGKIVKGRSTAAGLVAAFSEAVAKMIEVFGTLVVMLVIAVVVGEWAHSLAWGIGIAVFGVVGSALSLYYRSKEHLDSSVTTLRSPQRRVRPGSGRILEADLELPEELRDERLQRGGSLA
jgi:hypothetical protein